jgi:2-iminobutanoate/2-iminopropanoate deaminase
VSPPLGPYSPIVSVGDWLVCSGQLGVQDGELVAGGVGPQVTKALDNAAGLLADHGATLADVVKTMVFLTDIADYTVMNEAYVAAFGDHRPARSAVAVLALPRGAAVEIECWAHRPA